MQRVAAAKVMNFVESFCDIERLYSDALVKLTNTDIPELDAEYFFIKKVVMDYIKSSSA